MFVYNKSATILLDILPFTYFKVMFDIKAGSKWFVKKGFLILIPVKSRFIMCLLFAML